VVLHRGEPDIPGVCLGCGTIFLLPHVPLDPGIANGDEPAGDCPSCAGLVVAVDAATEHLTDLVVTIRRSGSLHYATLLSLVESWQIATPEPLAAIAELAAVAPEVLEVFAVRDKQIGVRMALGQFLLTTLPALMTEAGVAHYDAEVAARGVLEAVIDPATI